jgi:adenine phosphoribosyltransferase
MAEMAKDADVIVGPDARGFLFGTPVAAKLKKPFVMIRKPGKLPGETIKEEYELEYGTNILEIHKGAIKPGQKVIIIDDLLATGGTAKAIINLVEKSGGVVIKFIFLINLSFLKGAKDLVANNNVEYLLEYDSPDK